ncbi:MAG: putative porin [Candidatus Latescibacterota bacterium]|nr:MAG: putative porin [Candidatus Latescibacterota bacterium]
MRRCLYVVALAALVVGVCPVDGIADDDKEPRVKFSGDIRGRWEGFWFNEDPTGNEKADRRRIRYRVRFDAKATINDHAKMALRLGTGQIDNRSGNQTLGEPVDFSPSAITFRRAYLTFYPWAKGGLGSRDGHLSFHFGRVAIPFVWKNGKDIMLLDNDLNPNGLSVNFDINMGESAMFFVNAGVFIIEEKSGEVDPNYSGVQAGVQNKFSDAFKAGIRGSWYYFSNLDTLFLQRGIDGEGGVTSAGGNIPGGLTGDPLGGRLNVWETQAFVNFGKSEKWPVTGFGGFSYNQDASETVFVEDSDTLAIDKEGIAYNAGIEFGNKKKTVLLGFAYFHIEANAFPSQFIDSDLLDGHTNRKGPFLYFKRQILKGTDFNVQLFRSAPIEENNVFVESVKNSKRTRIQVDLVYKF